VPNHGGYTTTRPSAWVEKLGKQGAAFSLRKYPYRNKDNNANDVKEDEESFYHRKPSSKEGVKNDSDSIVPKDE
jgi:hypothetical protein